MPPSVSLVWVPDGHPKGPRGPPAADKRQPDGEVVDPEKGCDAQGVFRSHHRRRPTAEAETRPEPGEESSETG